jgi:NAD(P)-dependent dehydrogenase (short-subunit alcohol dehydrogenase family)
MLGGQVAFLIGGAGGIGSAVAQAFVDFGAAVVLIDQAEERASERAAGLRARGGRAAAVAGEATAFGSIEETLDRAEEAFGRAGVMMYLAAAYAPVVPAVELSPEDFAHDLEHNLTAQFAWARACGRRMSKDGGGSIILMGSVLGWGGTPRNAAYNASRGGDLQLVRALAVEWAPLGIRVNGIAPGWVWTEALKNTGRNYEPMARRSPSGRLGTPEDIAGPAVFLASQLSRWVTGVMLAVDGGTAAYLGPGDPPDA